MTASDDMDGFAEFTLQSPGDGAYQVELFNQRGLEMAEFTMMGRDASQKVFLEPGDYVGRIVDLVSRTTIETPIVLPNYSSEVAISLEAVDEDEDQVRQSSYLSRNNRGKLEKLRRSHRISSFLEEKDSETEGSTDSDASDWASDLASVGNESVILPTGRSIDRQAEFQRGLTDPLRRKSISKSAVLKSEIEGLRYDIGVSEDMMIGKQGGWSLPSDVEIACQSGADGNLIIAVKKAGETGHHSRLRMTVSIEGLPSIRIPVPTFNSGVQIILEPIVVDGKPDFIVSVVAVEPRKQALVTALSQLDRNDAQKFLETQYSSVEDAVLILARKKRDYWAATIAALVLVRSGHIGNREHWLRNLAEWAPHISDAPVAAAWACAASKNDDVEQTEAEVLRYLVMSGAIGAPNFMVGQRMGLELLDSLRSTARDTGVRRSANTHYKRWSKRVKARLFDTPYLIWEDLRENLRSGKLPAARYGRVGSGVLTLDGFHQK